MRRLIYDEIAEMNDFPNYEGAKFLGFCLNVMGLKDHGRYKMRADSIALQKAVLSWTRKNFAKLYFFNPRVALAGFVENMSYDDANRRIVSESLPGLSREPERHFFVVDPAPIDAESKGKQSPTVRQNGAKIASARHAWRQFLQAAGGSKPGQRPREKNDPQGRLGGNSHVRHSPVARRLRSMQKDCSVPHLQGRALLGAPPHNQAR